MAVSANDKIVRGGDLATIGAQVKAKLAEKQDALVSGTNIKTINNTSLLGGGDISITDGQDGASAYELWLDAGNTGTVADFLESLKGDTGVVIDEETFMGTIVNDKTTGGANKAWSAEMGKELSEDVSIIDGYKENYASNFMTETEVNPLDYSLRNFWINDSNVYASSTSNKHVIIPVSQSQIVTITTGSNVSTLAWLTSDETPTAGGTPPFVEDTVKFVQSSNSIKKYTVPATASYLYVYLGSASEYAMKPSSIIIEDAKDLSPVNQVHRAEIGKISGVGLVSEMVLENGTYTEKNYDLDNIYLRPYSLSASNYTAYGTSDTYKHAIFDIKGGDILKVKTNPTAYTYIAFVVNYTFSRASSAISFAPEVSMITQLKNTEQLYIAPEGTNAVLIYWGSAADSYPYKPLSVKVYENKIPAQQTQLSLTGNEEIETVVCSRCRAHNGALGTTTSYDIGKTVKVKEGETYIVEYSTQAAGNSQYVFTNTIPSNSTPIPDGASDTLTSQQRAKKLVLTAPFDGYLTIIKLSTSTAITFDYFRVYREVKDNNLTLKSISSIEEDVNSLLLNSLNFKAYDVLSLTKRSYTILSPDGSYGGADTYKHTLIPVTPGQYVKVRTNQTSGWASYIAWFTSDEAPTSYGEPPYVQGTGVIRILSSTDYSVFKVPSGTSFLYVYLGSASGSDYKYGFAPSYLGIADPKDPSDDQSSANAAELQIQTLRDRINTRAEVIGLTPTNIEVDEQGWEVPNTIQQLNVVKKALQLVRLKWTPITTVPGKYSNHNAGIQQPHGIPYSGNWHEYKYVGIEVSIHTFMTAVHNPYSLLYTENISANNSASAWGKTYYNSNGFAYYGTVCCGFSSGVVGLPFKYGNAKPKLLARYNGAFVPIYPQSVDGLRIGDICDGGSHSLVIIGLKRDSNGKVTQVKIAESTSSVEGCRTVTYTTPESFYNVTINRSSNPMQIFRCAELYKNIDYTPSPYVPLTDYGESETTVTYNDDICCFAGDKATFMKGDRVAINYNLTASPTHTWTAIELYKDNVLLNTYNLSEIDQSALADSQKNHALDLGTTLEYGKYKARMTDGTNYSDYTYFEVLSDDITVTYEGGGAYRIKANFTEKMRMLIAGRVVAGEGWFVSAAYREPDWAESQDNEAVFYFDEILKYFNLDPTIYDHLRISIQGEYGIAATPPIILPNKQSEEQGGGDDEEQDPDNAD